MLSSLELLAYEANPNSCLRVGTSRNLHFEYLFQIVSPQPFKEKIMNKEFIPIVSAASVVTSSLLVVNNNKIGEYFTWKTNLNRKD